MPEITDAELREFVAYQSIGTVTDVRKKLGDFEKDNKDQRDEIRTLKGLVPKETEVVVPKSDADRLEKYKALGKPEEIEGKLTEGADAAKNLLLVSRKTAAAAFVQAAGLAPETVDTLIAIPDLAKATFSVVDGKVKDAKGLDVDAKLPQLVLPVGEGDATETLDYAKALERFPALKGLRVADATTPKPSVNFVPQGPGDKNSGPTDVYSRIRTEAEKKAEAAKVTSTAAKPLEARLGMTNGS